MCGTKEGYLVFGVDRRREDYLLIDRLTVYFLVGDCQLLCRVTHTHHTYTHTEPNKETENVGFYALLCLISILNTKFTSLCYDQ